MARTAWLSKCLLGGLLVAAMPFTSAQKASAQGFLTPLEEGLLVKLV